MKWFLAFNPKGNYTKLEDYFNCEDSCNLILFNNLMTADKALYLRKSDNCLYFVNGPFPAGEKVINIFLKKGLIIPGGD